MTTHETDSADLDADDFPQPYLCESDDSRSLHFDRVAVQSEMRTSRPDELVLGYTRTMMAALLFNPAPRDIAMIGLGGGSLAKYCLARLPHAHVVAIEVNPHVIALRHSFKLPRDNEHLQIVCADGAAYLRRRGKSFDWLLIDGFDHTGQPPQLCTQRFYDDCYARLRANGVAVVNLLDDDTLDDNLWRLRQSFDRAVVLSSSEDNLNKVAFAVKGDIATIIENQLSERYQALNAQHPVNLRRSVQTIRRGWAKALAQR